MITPSPNCLPAEPPLPFKHPSVGIHPSSLGSKLAAHFTPLRSPSRNTKIWHSMIQKPDVPAPPLPSPSALSPRIPEIRASSIESQRSSMRSRSTTPRPFRGTPSTAAENGDEEDFSDLFTLPNHLKKPQQSPKTPSATSVHIYLGDSPKSGEVTPTTPVTPSGPPLYFPIPPSTVVPRPILVEKGFSHYSRERASLSSRGSRSPSKVPSPGVVPDSGSSRTFHSDLSSQDGRRSNHRRTTSVSGSDTDTSRANDSTYSATSFKLSPVVPSRKQKLSASSVVKTSSGPPPSAPLPSPPLSPNPGILSPRSDPSTPNRVAFPRPRANTLSVTSNLVVPGHAVPKSNHPSPPRSSRANSDAVRPDATVEELKEALSLQRRKNAQLQEYIGTITKRYEDDRVAMARTIEKLERNVRKKMREIEGLRWLVIHNGAVSDIDAAANLARSSLSTQDGDGSDGAQRTSPLSPSPVTPPHHDGSPFHQSSPGPKGAGINALSTTSEFRPDASVISFATSSEASLTTPSLSVIPERIDGISRSERQKLKEERRASKALRRISAASTFALGANPLPHSPSVDSPLDPNFDPKQSMDKVLEKLQPFRNT